MRIARCIEAEQKSAAEGESSGLPVFVIICTKMIKMPNFTPVCISLFYILVHL